MIRKSLILILFLVLPAQVIAASAHAIVTEDEQEIVAARAGHVISIQAVAILGISDSGSTSCWLYNGTNEVFGSETYPLVVDLTGSAAPGGFVLPYNEGGWLATDAAGEAMQAGLAGESPVPVIILVTYEYVRIN